MSIFNQVLDAVRDFCNQRGVSPDEIRASVATDAELCKEMKLGAGHPCHVWGIPIVPCPGMSDDRLELRTLGVGGAFIFPLQCSVQTFRFNSQPSQSGGFVGIDYGTLPKLEEAPKAPRCECGAAKCGSPGHSTWCPLA